MAIRCCVHAVCSCQQACKVAAHQGWCTAYTQLVLTEPPFRKQGGCSTTHTKLLFQRPPFTYQVVQHQAPMFLPGCCAGWPHPAVACCPQQVPDVERALPAQGTGREAHLRSQRGKVCAGVWDSAGPAMRGTVLVAAVVGDAHDSCMGTLILGHGHCACNPLTVCCFSIVVAHPRLVIAALGFAFPRFRCYLAFHDAVFATA